MKVKWYYYWMRYLYRIKCGVLWEKTGRKFVKRDFLDNEQTNEYIKFLLNRDEPFMVCRIGATESFNMRVFEFADSKNYERAVNQLCSLSGFFPENSLLAEKFVDMMKEAMREADLCGTLLAPFDEYFMNQYLPADSKVMFLPHVDPTGYEQPWTWLLKGKKVLVVHPFTETIQRQYQRRELIFPGWDILPEFELITIKAVQTIAGQKDERFQTWFDALNYMTEEIEKIDFDVALLGCGAYGMPLAARIKKMGKQVIHEGGGLQLLFGIRGKRWDGMPEAQKLFNEYWVYPSENETPAGSGKVEEGCYWK